MGVTLDQITQQGLSSLDTSCAQGLRIRQIIEGACVHKMDGLDGRVFSDLRILLVFTDQAHGFTYHHDRIESATIAALIDRPLQEVARWQLTPAIKTAVADCIFDAINKHDHYYNFIGDVPQRAEQRARAVVQGIEPGARVLLLGAVSEMVSAIVARGAILSITDMAAEKIGRTIDGIAITSPTPQPELQGYDYIIATGMVFATDTADGLFDAIRTSNVKLRIFMESGAGFANKLIELGADLVLAEQFPFYDLSPGNSSKFKLFRKKPISTPGTS
jgi:hypothetical protein